MPDARILKQAQVLVDYSANVQPGDTVFIMSSTLAAPLLEAMYQRVLERGGHPTVQADLPGLKEIMLRHANDDQLRHPSYFFASGGLDYFDHIFQILAPNNTRSASGVDPRRQALNLEASRPYLAKWTEKIMRDTKATTIALHPTPALAQEASMSLLDYEDFVYAACLLNEPDPVAAWQAKGEQQARLRDWLVSKSTLHVQGPHIDLKLSIAGRGWISDDGHKNFPGGEVFTSPVEDSVEGWVHFTHPTTYNSRQVHAVQLWFEGGRVVKHSAASGEDYLAQMLIMDEGARRLGEFAIGTNYGVTRVTGNVLFDEKIGGTCHLAVGRGFPNLGSQVTSAIHWDMVCDIKTDSQISADGEVFYRNGDFLPPFGPMAPPQ